MEGCFAKRLCPCRVTPAGTAVGLRGVSSSGSGSCWAGGRPSRPGNGVTVLPRRALISQTPRAAPRATSSPFCCSSDNPETRVDSASTAGVTPLQPFLSHSVAFSVLSPFCLHIREDPSLVQTRTVHAPCALYSSLVAIL